MTLRDIASAILPYLGSAFEIVPMNIDTHLTSALFSVDLWLNYSRMEWEPFKKPSDRLSLFIKVGDQWLDPEMDLIKQRDYLKWT